MIAAWSDSLENILNPTPVQEGFSVPDSSGTAGSEDMSGFNLLNFWELQDATQAELPIHHGQSAGLIAAPISWCSKGQSTKEINERILSPAGLTSFWLTDKNRSDDQIGELYQLHGWFASEQLCSFRVTSSQWQVWENRQKNHKLAFGWKQLCVFSAIVIWHLEFVTL